MKTRKGLYYDKPNTSVTVKIKMILKLKVKVVNRVNIILNQRHNVKVNKVSSDRI